jgi:hypothetical protein
MNGEDLRFLANRAEGVHGRPESRLTEVHARIRSVRRRRAAEAVGGACVVVLAVVVGVAALTGPGGDEKDDGPIPPASTRTPTAKAVRQIVYSDDLSSIPHRGDTPLSRVGIVHVGDREVRIDQVLRTVQRWALRVTDAGAVYAKDDGTVWLTDGGAPQRIAENACVDTTQYGGLATGNAGPWAVWFDCSPASRGADLVVFDTGSGREAARTSIPACRGRLASWPAYKCSPSDVIGGHVYFTAVVDDATDAQRAFVLDVATNELVRATPGTYARDIDANPRGLVIGDDRRTGYRTTGTDQQFLVRGSRLVAEMNVDSEQFPARAMFDTGTGRPVHLRLPDGYHPRRSDPTDDPPFFVLFEWLDNDTVALARGNTGTHYGDILVCHLSAGPCEVAVKAPGGTATRIVAGSHLPG